METDSLGRLIGLHLDDALPVAGLHFMDASPNLADEANLALLGMQSGAMIQRPSGATVHPAGGGGSYLAFSPPIDPGGIDIGTLVTVGPIGSETLRLIIFGIRPRPGFQASVTAVDEASELFRV